MTTSNRATLINKTHKVLKRTYKHTPTKGEQPVLESLLFACCLENARHDLAHDMLAKLRAAFFDWNEIRVTTVKELAEVMDGLPEATEAAARLKGVLQSVFESDYSFDLEPLKKQNIGAAVKRLQKLQGADFVWRRLHHAKRAGRPLDPSGPRCPRLAARTGRDLAAGSRRGSRSGS